MRVGIITLHSSYSYGACLQAYSTYLVVKKLGHDPIMIDYVNEYEQNQNRVISRKPDFSFAKNTLYTLENILLLKRYNMKKAFSEFHNLYEKTAHYSSLTSLQKQIDNEKIDCLISGSDQLWNPDIFNGIDTAFMLDFGSPSQKRIAYAASAGSHIFSNEEIDKISPLLRQYDAISVRENILKEQLDCALETDIAMVLDPTFLLSPEEWLEFAKGVHRYEGKKYILLYMIGVPHSEYRKRYAPIARYYASILKLPVFAINPMSFIKVNGAERNITNASPNELINLIKGAEMIITSSFHGVAFSISLNKTFVALKTANPARISALLRTLDLDNRIIDSYDETKCNNLLSEIDYGVSNQKLNQLREVSKRWLAEQLK